MRPNELTISYSRMKAYDLIATLVVEMFAPIS